MSETKTVDPKDVPFEVDEKKDTPGKETTPSIEEIAETYRKAAVITQKKSNPNEYKVSIPTGTIRECIIRQGVAPEAIDDTLNSIIVQGEALHRAGTTILIDKVKEAKKEDRDKIVVSLRSDIAPKTLRYETTIRAKTTGMSVPREDRASTPYTNYGQSVTKLTLNARINKQVEEDSRAIQRCFEDLGE